MPNDSFNLYLDRLAIRLQLLKAINFNTQMLQRAVQVKCLLPSEVSILEASVFRIS